MTRPDSDMVVVRLSHLGDVTLTSGVLAHWHATHGHTFSVVTRHGYARLFDHHPAVREVLGVNAAGLDNWFKTANAITRRLGNRPLIDLHRTSRSLLLAAMWKERVIKYPKYPLARRMYRWFRHGPSARRLARLNVPQRYALALDGTPPAVEMVRPRVFLQPEEREQASTFLIERGLVVDGSRPLVALHPYATHAAKAWPAEYWQELTRAIEARGWQWLVIGASRTRPLAEAAGVRDLTGETDIRGSLAILAACDALVSGDSGPMHLATAVDTPVVALFGPTTRHWGFFPSGERDMVLESDLPCRPCSLHGGKGCDKDNQCLRDIAAERVVVALEELL